ncbi:MAG: hypothetical protein N2749_00930 [Clostridia bacterium]|nr:hypothetical protein [Clostridia bacterium]
MENKIVIQEPQILDFLLRPAVEYNPPANSYWGVAFRDNKAYVVSGTFCIVVEGLKDIKPEGEFFSFFENKYTKIPWRISLDDVIARISSFEFTGSVAFPITNFINRLGELPQDKRKKSRVVFAQTFKEDGDFFLRFRHNGQRLEFKAPGMTKPVWIDNMSFIPEQFVKLDTPYRCKLREADEAIYANVIEPYGKVRMGIVYSEAGFDPKNLESVHKMIGIPQDMILCSNAIAPVENFYMPPIHIDATMLYDLSKVLLASKSKFVEMHFGKEFKDFVMFRNIKEMDEDLQITIFVAPLDISYGIQRR